MFLTLVEAMVAAGVILFVLYLALRFVLGLFGIGVPDEYY